VKTGLIFGGAFMAMTLGLVYAFQDKILYIPGTPIRYIKDNARGYRSP